VPGLKPKLQIENLAANYRTVRYAIAAAIRIESVKPHFTVIQQISQSYRVSQTSHIHSGPSDRRATQPFRSFPLAAIKSPARPLIQTPQRFQSSSTNEKVWDDND